MATPPKVTQERVGATRDESAGLTFNSGCLSSFPPRFLSGFLLGVHFREASPKPQLQAAASVHVRARARPCSGTACLPVPFRVCTLPNMLCVVTASLRDQHDLDCKSRSFFPAVVLALCVRLLLRRSIGIRRSRKTLVAQHCLRGSFENFGGSPSAEEHMRIVLTI